MTPPSDGLTGAARLRSSRVMYWICQVGGWSAFGMFQFLGRLAAMPGAPIASSFVAAAVVPATLGLLGTHVLHVLIRRRPWLDHPGPLLPLKLTGAILLLGAALDAARLLSAHVTDPMAPPVLEFRTALLSYGTWVLLLVAWTALYLAIREWRERRRRDIRALRLEVLAQEGRLRGLRAQLNPHFFFNCLNTLREMIDEDPARAQLMVTQLSALTRYALDSNLADLASLKDEVEAVRHYLSLETIRFEERLRVAWDVAPDVEGARVPPLLLQTLVENAVKHGIARRPAGGTVTIAAHLGERRLRLAVTNSGTLSTPGAGAGLGLRNARERLRLLYGERARLVLEAAGDDLVQALAELPA